MFSPGFVVVFICVLSNLAMVYLGIRETPLLIIVVFACACSGPEVIKLFSCLTQHQQMFNILTCISIINTTSES